MKVLFEEYTYAEVTYKEIEAIFKNKRSEVFSEEFTIETELFLTERENAFYKALPKNDIYRLYILVYKNNEPIGWHIGFQKNDIQFILENHLNEFQEFEKHFKYFENIKTYKAAEKVADGNNKPAIFNMRDLLRELPTLLLKNKCAARKDTFTLFDVMISKNASPRDYKFKEIYHRKLLDLQCAYLKLVELSRRKRSCERVLREIENRSKVINRADRATGNAIICVVESLIQGIRNHLQTGCIQEVIDSYVLSQVLKPKEGLYNSRDILKHQPKEAKKLLFKLLKITTELKDEI